MKEKQLTKITATQRGESLHWGYIYPTLGYWALSSYLRPYFYHSLQSRKHKSLAEIQLSEVHLGFFSSYTTGFSFGIYTSLMFKNKFQQRQGSRCLVFLELILLLLRWSIQAKKKSNQVRLPVAKVCNTNGHHSPRNPAARNKQAGKDHDLFACKPHESDPEKWNSPWWCIMLYYDDPVSRAV